MIDSLEAYIEYFKTLADNHAKVKSFIYGPSERLLNDLRTNTDLPVFWLMNPTVRANKHDEDGEVWNVGFIIFDGAEIDDWEKENEVEQCTLDIAKQFIARLKEEDCDKIELYGSFNLDPCQPWAADNLHGWRVELQMIVEQGCFEDDVDEAVWVDQ